MTSNNISQPFLNLVERANDLVQELQELEKVVKSYNQVSNDLAQASRGLFDATTQYTGIASQVGQVATSMQQIGMPQLLDAVQRAQQEASANSANILSALQVLLSAGRETQKLLDAVQRAQQEASANFANMLSALQATQEASGEGIERLLSAAQQAQSDIHALLAASGELQEQQRREAARTRLFVIVGAGLATAAGVAATVVPTLNLA